MNEMNLSDDFWNRELHETYWDLLIEVHKKEDAQSWTCGEAHRA